MRIYLRGETWQVAAKIGKKRFRRSLETRDPLIAAERSKALLTALQASGRSEGAAWSFTSAWIAKRAGMTRYRSKGAGLSDAELRHIVDRANGRCELTGIEFSSGRPMNCKRAPFEPSVDRIDHRLPYSPENCRLVCLGVNIALNQWGEEALRRIALGILAPQFPPQRDITH